MKNIVKLIGIIALATIIGFSFVSCSNSGGGGSGNKNNNNANNNDNNNNDNNNNNSNNAAKTLAITNIPDWLMEEADHDGGLLGLYEAGTTVAQAANMQKLVAGADLGDAVISGSGPFKATVPLIDLKTDKPWTGSGTFDVYVAVWGEYDDYYYKAASINFTSATTTVSFTNATRVYP
jgi:hypothetical protein